MDATAATLAHTEQSPMSTDKPIAAIREEDEYRQFREKRKMSKKKIKGFFGESMQYDVSVRTIEQKGLSAILQSYVPLCYFLNSLLGDMNAENLFFYLEVEQFEEHDFHTVKAMKKTAMELYDAFVKPGAHFEINLEGKVRDSILPKIEAGDQNCFADARRHTVNLLVPCFSNFVLGPTFTRMIDELGENNTMYTKKQRNNALKALLEFIDKVPSSAIVADDKTCEDRRVMLRAMIHSFCRTRLRCDFKDDLAGKKTRQNGGKKIKKPSEEAMAYAT